MEVDQQEINKTPLKLRKTEDRLKKGDGKGKVKEMRSRFDKQIACIRQKYGQSISKLLRMKNNSKLRNVHSANQNQRQLRKIANVTPINNSQELMR